MHGALASVTFVALVLFAVARSKRLSDFIEALADERLGWREKWNSFRNVLKKDGL
jgi:hypothetical protein